MKELKCVMLIDDDDATNYLHKMVLEEYGITENIEVAESAKEAIHLLQHPRINECEKPDLMFLDLNMPGMNGWDFLAHIREQKVSCPKPTFIYILTTSENPEDAQRAKSLQEVSGFISKPLTSEHLQLIMNKHFLKGE